MLLLLLLELELVVAHAELQVAQGALQVSQRLFVGRTKFDWAPEELRVVDESLIARWQSVSVRLLVCLSCKKMGAIRLLTSSR